MNDQPTSIHKHLTVALDEIEETAPKGMNPCGLHTGFRDLDALTAGLQPGTLTVIASRPGMGRTTLLSDICRRTAIADGLPTAVWTLEEEPDQFCTRVLCAEARVARHHVSSGNLTNEDWNRMAQHVPNVAGAPLYIGSPPSITTSEIAEQAAELARESHVMLIAVDGIQDIRPEKRSDLREREVGDVVRDLKTLARELQVPVLATSHLNRGPEQRINKKPRLDDLRESGAITFAADTIILLHREDYYEKDSPRAGEADLIVAKHRHGPTALITVAFMAHYGRFVDMLPEDTAPPKPAASDFKFDLNGLFNPKAQDS